ncbi:LysR family transcriptional regulator [Aquisalimonas lutea]|uniref:LysR family transcriptional regulator n=1 Tax=Aquisalimonas lutea TaxID=1327750 RepID=UPI0025B5C118|nr:LysR family transcriptional regulator [Aquisalimonas lutea]MDN3518605.1 LysR family transcriptional regulator [Aquisalimonas lutea]
MTDPSGRLYYKNNRVKQLRAFCYTAQAGSISRAAERLYLSQPSVSLQIQALERELDITLFERRGPRITLTPDGKALYELAQPLVDGIDALPSRFAERHQTLQTGRLDIAAGESSTLYLIPDLLKEYMNRYPDSPVKLHNVVGSDMLAALRNDEVDFGIGSMLELPDDVAYRAVYSFDTSLILPRGHRLAERERIELDDLASQELILPPRHLTTWRLVNLVLQQHNIPYEVRLEVGGWEIMKAYVERGFGIGIASNICITGREDLVVKSLPSIFPRRTYGVMWRRGRFLSPQAKRFIELMQPGFFDDPGTDTAAGAREDNRVFVPSQNDTGTG